MTKSPGITLYSYCRQIVSGFYRSRATSPVAKLLRSIPVVHRQLLVTLAVATVLIYVLFQPVFEGFTLSDMASRQMGLYPWAAKVQRRLPPMHYDQADTFYPWQVFMNRAVESGEVPLWNPYSFGGHPWFANGQNGFLYLPKTYLSIVTTPSRVHDWLVLSHMLLGAAFMFLLLAKSRLSFAASLFGAIAWMLNSFMLSWMSLEHFVVIEAWLPLAVLLARRAASGSAMASVGLGITMALMFLGGNLLFVELTFAALACYMAYLIVRRWRRLRGSEPQHIVKRITCDAALAAVAFAVCGGLIAVQLLPTLDMVGSIERAPLSYTELVRWKLPIAELRGFFFEPRHMLLPPAGTGEEPYHRMLFLGTPTAILALIGFWRRNPLVKFMRAMAALLLLIALGTPITWFTFRFLPGFGHFKPLGRVLFLFDFAVAILGAFGLDWTLSRLPELIRLNLGRWRQLWHFAGTTALTLVVVVQLSSVAAWVVRYQADNAQGILYPETPLIKALGHDEKTRMLAVHPSFYGSTAMVFAIQNAGGYDSMVPTRMTRLWRVIQGETVENVIGRAPASAFVTVFGFDSRFDLLPRVNVTHVVTPPLTPVLGCKGPLDETSALNATGIVTEGNLVIGDWNGDGIDTVGVYDWKNKRFLLWNSNDFRSDPVSFPVDPAGESWAPFAGDWTNSGRDSVGLYDASTSSFHLWYVGGAHISFQYGPVGSNWIPIAGDWNGDRTATVGLYDPDKTEFHLQNSNKAQPETELAFPFGLLFNKGYPVVGDWDGDRVDTVGVYYPGLGAFHLRTLNAWGDADMIIKYGPRGESLRPLAGHWNKEVSRVRFDTVGLYGGDGRVSLCLPAFFGKTELDKMYSAEDGDIYKVRDPLPRAYVVYDAEKVDNPEAALRRLVDDNFDPKHSVIVESSYLNAAAVDVPAAPRQRGDHDITAADILDRTLNSLTIKVNAEQDGWLVVAESWDPGWVATLDNQRVPLLPGNYAFRTLKVPAGQHVVKMVYAPRTFTIGSFVSAGTLIVIGFVAVWKLWRPNRGQAA